MLNLRHIKFVLIILIGLFSFHYSFAANLKINASLLPSIWYSTLDPYGGDTVKIFGGIQNQTSFTLDATVQILVDNVQKEIVEIAVMPGTLTQIKTAWLAEAGNHDIVMRITHLKSDISGIDADSLQLKEVKNSISVSRKIDLGETKVNIQNIATTSLKKIDDAADALADTILSYQAPTTTHPKADEGQVLGASTRYSPAAIFESVKQSPVTKGIWNSLLEFVALCVRHWKITLSVIILLAIVIKYAMS